MYTVNIGTVKMTAEELGGVSEILAMRQIGTYPDEDSARIAAEEVATALSLTETNGTDWWWTPSLYYRATRATWIEEV